VFSVENFSRHWLGFGLVHGETPQEILGPPRNAMKTTVLAFTGGAAEPPLGWAAGPNNFVILMAARRR